MERVLNGKINTFHLSPKEGIDKHSINADTPIPFSLNKLWYDLYTETLGTYYKKKTSSGSPIDNLAFETNSSGKLLKGDPDKGVPPIFKRPKDIAGDDEKINFMPNINGNINIGNQLITLVSKLRIPKYDFLFRPGDD